MTPMRDEERQALLDSHPSGAPGEIEADIAEYERLVSAMFSQDPDEAPAGAPAALESFPAASRLNELHEKLYGQLAR